MARYNLDGTPDTTFGTGGQVVNNVSTIATGGDQISTVAIRPNGQIVAAGSVTYQVTLPNGKVADQSELGVVQYNTDGSIDDSFGSNPDTGMPGGGIAVLRPGPSAGANGIALQADGSIVVSGAAQLPGTYDYALLARFNQYGILDTTFAGDGYVALGLDPTGSNSGFSGVAIQTDGSIVVSAWAQTAGSFLMRFNADGSQDTTFGDAGRAPLALGPAGLHLPTLPVYLQADGEILVTGDVGQAVGAALYLASAPQIGSFTANSNPVTAGSSVTLTASSITDGNPGVSIAQVAFYLDSNNDGKLESGSDTLLGYATQTSPGVWTLTNSSAFGLTAGTYTLFAQAKDSDGVFGDPIALTLTVQ